MQSHSFQSLTHRVFLALLVLVQPMALSALAADEGMELKTEAFQEVVVKGADGKPEKKRQAVATAVPGAEIIYVITYRNTGAKAAENVVVNNPVPVGLAFVPGSAQGAGTRAEVSVDQGKNFGALETLRIKGANGALRAAKGDDVSNVRWTVLAPLVPAASGSVTYRAVLK